MGLQPLRNNRSARGVSIAWEVCIRAPAALLLAFLASLVIETSRTQTTPALPRPKLPEAVSRSLLIRSVAPGYPPAAKRTPDGEILPVFSEALAAAISRRYGAPGQMMQLRNGIFDDASTSVIAAQTILEIARLAGRDLDVRRFRPNILVRLLQPGGFQQDAWEGGTLSFGEGDGAPTVAVTTRDVRCAMVNLDPDTAKPSPEVMKPIVRVNQNNAGVYGTVIRTGQLSVGQPIFLRA